MARAETPFSDDVPGSESASAPIIVCDECDWLMRRPQRAGTDIASCPRCGHHIAGPDVPNVQRPLAWASATLVVLALAFAFPFLGFSASGVGHVMDFIDAASTLFGKGYGAIALVLLATTVGFPALYLLGLIYFCADAQMERRLPGAIALARWLRSLEPWMMADVFIVGVLVSLVKIVSLADIHIRTSFIAFCVYAAMLFYTLRLVDWTRLWSAIIPPPALGDASQLRLGTTARNQGLVTCSACAALFRTARQSRCPRCGQKQRDQRINRLQLTWALLATAAILIVPANAYPILYTVQLGSAQPQTIAAGVLGLARHGDWPIAVIIFVASILIPIGKILALAWLCLQAKRNGAGHRLAQTRVYRVTEKIGRWSMIDVFVVATLGALVQAGSLMAIRPGPAAVPFAGVVIVTMLAALVFDPRWLWRDAPSAAANDTPPTAHER